MESFWQRMYGRKNKASRNFGELRRICFERRLYEKETRSRTAGGRTKARRRNRKSLCKRCWFIQKNSGVLSISSLLPGSGDSTFVPREIIFLGGERKRPVRTLRFFAVGNEKE